MGVTGLLVDFWISLEPQTARLARRPGSVCGQPGSNCRLKVTQTRLPDSHADSVCRQSSSMQTDSHPDCRQLSRTADCQTRSQARQCPRTAKRELQTASHPDHMQTARLPRRQGRQPARLEPA